MASRGKTGKTPGRQRQVKSAKVEPEKVDAVEQPLPAEIEKKVPKAKRAIKKDVVPKQRKPKAKESVITDEKPIPPKAGMVPGGRGGWIQNGPGLGRPKARKATLTTLLEFLGEINPDTGNRWVDDFTASMVRQAMSGNRDIATLIFMALEKGEQSAASEDAVDPALGSMSDAALRLKVIKMLEADLAEDDDEIHEAEVLSEA